MVYACLRKGRCRELESPPAVHCKHLVSIECVPGLLSTLCMHSSQTCLSSLVQGCAAERAQHDISGTEACIALRVHRSHVVYQEGIRLTSQSPVSMFQMRMVPSACPAAMWEPLGLAATCVTSPAAFP